VDSTAFVKNVLPKFFKHEKLSSFTRQLNIYGFHKIREGPLKGAYTHEDFICGDLERVSSIPRTKRSGPREVMKVRESRNASVIYSSMMMRKGTGYTSDSSSSGSDYSSDSSSSCAAPKFVEYKIEYSPVMAAAPSVCSDKKRKRTTVNETSETSLFAILEKTRFSYKERSYVELKAETEQLATKKRKLEHLKTEVPTPGLELEQANFDDFSADFSDENVEDVVDMEALVEAFSSSEHEPVFDVLDYLCHDEVDFSLFCEGTHPTL